MLKGCLYEMVSSDGSAFRVRLLDGSVIYKAHFPGMPVTPGAALLKIVEELASEVLGRSCRIRALKDVKFLSIITPPAEIEFGFRTLPEVRGRIGMEVTVHSGGTLCAKMSLLLSHICAIIPTYNNSSTVSDVIARVREHLEDVIVVCDGCTDDTVSLLKASGMPLNVISYEVNRGKGVALKTGFREARTCGYDYAVTIDADGQHLPEDIPLLMEALKENPGALLTGSRNLNAENMPVGNTFANKFSNFWFRVQTGISLPDTQTGFRAYPLAQLPPLSLLTGRYESELELLVLMAWKGVSVVPVPVRVLYPEDRVTHFRPVRDFVRISVLNTAFCALAVIYGYPRKLVRKIFG